MRRDRESFNSPANPKNSQQKLEGNQIISPYDVIRTKNCKLFKIRRDETYPSIRPPVSQCDPEETAAFLAASMEANGLESFDPRFVRQPPIGVSSMSSDRKMDRSNERGIEIVNPCRTRRVQEPLYKPGAGRDSHMVLDWSKITPCDLMRLQNCKAFDFQKCERYPSIRPPASLCNAEWTAQWLASAVENYGCPRLFDMEIDDILDIWKRSPGKESLGFYGVGSGIATPEAIEYNQLVSKCLEKVSGRKRAEQKEDVMNPLAKSEAKPVPKTPGILLLNRSKLESKITKMPTVRKKLHPSTALNWIHCPGQAPRSALETENPVGKTKQREQQFCNCQLEVPENKCTDYEWMKYKEVAVSFQKELQQLAQEFENEPKNYDDLYAQLVSCFDKDAAQDPIAASYYKCCKRFSKSGGAQGAGKGSKGGGKYGDGGGDGDGRRTGDGDEAGDGNEAGDGDGEGAEHGELGESKGVEFEGIQGEGEGGAAAYGLGDGGQAAALGEKDKAAAGAGIGIGGTGSGDGKNKTKKPGDVKTDKADKVGGKYSKKTAAKSTKDLGKRPATDAKYPKDQAGQQPGTVKMFEFPNTLESVTEGETNTTEQKWISDLQNGSDDEIADSSRSSFWKRPSQEELGRKGKGKGGKGGKRKGSKAIGRGRGRKSGKESHSTDSTQARTKDCPCEICEQLTRRERDPPDPPFILEMLREQKHRQAIEYRQRLCHQAYLLGRCPEYPAPAHRCEPIQCDEPSSFSLHPKIAEYFDRLTALNDLQKLLCSKRDKVDRQLLQLVQNLKDRLCWRLNQLL